MILLKILQLAHSISNLYGDKVAELVDGLSKVDQLVYRSFEEKTAENFRKMLLATAADARVILIKLADRLHNMQTLSALSKKKREEFPKKLLKYSPQSLTAWDLMKSTGNWKICVLQICIQKGTKFSTKQSRKLGKQERSHFRITKKIVNHIPSFGVKGKVFGREKSLYSIYLKMKEKRVSFAEF